MDLFKRSDHINDSIKCKRYVNQSSTDCRDRPRPDPFLYLNPKNVTRLAIGQGRLSAGRRPKVWGLGEWRALPFDCGSVDEGVCVCCEPRGPLVHDVPRSVAFPCEGKLAMIFTFVLQV